MHRLSYVPGSGGEPVCMDCPGALSGTADGLRGRAWSYTLGYRGVMGASRPARECPVEVAFLDESAADELRRVADRDVADGTPGTLVADRKSVV